MRVLSNTGAGRGKFLTKFGIGVCNFPAEKNALAHFCYPQSKSWSNFIAIKNARLINTIERISGNKMWVLSKKETFISVPTGYLAL